MVVLTNVIRADGTEAVEGSSTRPVIEARNSWADADAAISAATIAIRNERKKIISLIRKQDSRVAAIVEIAALSEWDRAADLP